MVPVHHIPIEFVKRSQSEKIPLAMCKILEHSKYKKGNPRLTNSPYRDLRTDNRTRRTEYRHRKAATFALKSETYQMLGRAPVLGRGIKSVNTGIVIGDKLDKQIFKVSQLASCKVKIHKLLSFKAFTKFLLF